MLEKSYLTEAIGSCKPPAVIDWPDFKKGNVLRQHTSFDSFTDLVGIELISA